MKNDDLYSYLKHFTTLSSGSILVLLTISEKINKESSCKILVIMSIISFLVSILGSMLSYTIGIMQNDKATNVQSTLGGLGLFLTWFGFGLGIVFIAIYIIVGF